MLHYQSLPFAIGLCEIHLCWNAVGCYLEFPWNPPGEPKNPVLPQTTSSFHPVFRRPRRGLVKLSFDLNEGETWRSGHEAATGHWWNGSTIALKNMHLIWLKWTSKKHVLFVSNSLHQKKTSSTTNSIPLWWVCWTVSNIFGVVHEGWRPVKSSSELDVGETFTSYGHLSTWYPKQHVLYWLRQWHDFKPSFVKDFFHQTSTKKLMFWVPGTSHQFISCFKLTSRWDGDKRVRFQ